MAENGATAATRTGLHGRSLASSIQKLVRPSPSAAYVWLRFGSGWPSSTSRTADVTRIKTSGPASRRRRSRRTTAWHLVIDGSGVDVATVRFCVRIRGRRCVRQFGHHLVAEDNKSPRR